MPSALRHPQPQNNSDIRNPNLVGWPAHCRRPIANSRVPNQKPWTRINGRACNSTSVLQECREGGTKAPNSPSGSNVRNCTWRASAIGLVVQGASRKRQGHTRQTPAVLVLLPVKQFKHHSSPWHFCFKIGSVLLPRWRIPHPKPRLCAQAEQFIVRSQRSSNAKIHCGEAFISEDVIIHSRRPNDKNFRQFNKVDSIILTNHR
jgi:hypothetical protein